MKFMYDFPQEGGIPSILYNAAFDQDLAIENMSILGMFVLVCVCIFAAGIN